MYPQPRPAPRLDAHDGTASPLLKQTLYLQQQREQQGGPGAAVASCPSCKAAHWCSRGCRDADGAAHHASGECVLYTLHRQQCTRLQGGEPIASPDKTGLSGPPGPDLGTWVREASLTLRLLLLASNVGPSSSCTSSSRQVAGSQAVEDLGALPTAAASASQGAVHGSCHLDLGAYEGHLPHVLNSLAQAHNGDAGCDDLSRGRRWVEEYVRMITHCFSCGREGSEVLPALDELMAQSELQMWSTLQCPSQSCPHVAERDCLYFVFNALLVVHCLALWAKGIVDSHSELLRLGRNTVGSQQLSLVPWATVVGQSELPTPPRPLQLLKPSGWRW
jgi:hypothetical protein